MTVLFSNNGSGTLSAEIIIEAGPSAVTLQTNEGTLFPSPSGSDYFVCTVEDTGGNLEIMHCTDVTGDVLTCIRAQESTTGQAFAIGSRLELRVTDGVFGEFIQQTGDQMSGELDMDDNILRDPLITDGESRNMPIRGTDGGTFNEIVVPTASGAPTIGGNTIWHAGNDGAASGLDADTLDGAEGTDYVQEDDATVTLTGVVTLDGVVTTAAYGSGGRIKDGGDLPRPIGYNVMPLVEQDTAGTFNLATNGMLLHRDDTVAIDHTLPDDSDIPVGATYVLTNEGASGLFRLIGDTGVTVKFFDAANGVITSVVAGNGFTLAVAAVASVYKYTDTEWHIWGGGITET